MRGVQTGAQRIVQRRLRDVQIGRPLDLLFLHRRQVHPDRQHIHFRGHARRMHRLEPRQIGFGRFHRLLGRLQALARQHRP